MWKEKAPSYGDQIRVNRGLYFHHGIYVSDDEVIQYASPKGSEIIEDTALIIKTSLAEFLKGGVLEVREYTIEELKKKRSNEEIVDFARSMLGTGLGEYSIVNNNCEHFSNYCAFGEKKSNQVEDFLSMLFGR